MPNKVFFPLCFLILSQVYAASPQSVSDVNNERRLLKCMACHGQNFEKSTFDKAAVLKGQSASVIEASLLEYKYKDPSTGETRNKVGFGKMMKGQVKDISDADLKAIAASIAEIK